MKNIWNKLEKKKGIIIIALVLFMSLGFTTLSDKDFKIAKNLDIFVTLFREINLYYVDDKDPEELIESSIEGMLESLDPYTTFIPESEKDEFKFMTTGQYGGIGALIRRAGEYTIISEPYEGFPAQKSGLMAGDTIITIDGKSIKGTDISDVSELLKGKPNTEVDLVIKRYGDSETRTFSLIREKVTIKNVPYYDIIDNVGYIRLGNFHENAGEEVGSALKELLDKKPKGIIIDLRNNPGGLLKEAVNVAGVFVGKGQEIVSTKGKVKHWDNDYTTITEPVDTNIQLVVLVNRSSASASEIVAGALQDLDRAVVIGQRTFGKGLVQVTRPLSYNTQLKITTAKYYIPSGRCIQALDYSHRNEDGSVGHIPDSLISEFLTRNGRKVYDGGGVNPDIKIEYDVPGNISVSLYAENLFFDYATKYSTEYDSIKPLDKFVVTDEIFNDFKSFIQDKEFDYNSQSSEKLEELIEIAKQEKYYDLAKDEFVNIEKKLKSDKVQDLTTFKEEIKELIEEEIMSRYYYQKGRIRSAINHDPQIDKAIEVINNNELYTSVLTGTYKDGEIITAKN